MRQHARVEREGLEAETSAAASRSRAMKVHRASPVVEVAAHERAKCERVVMVDERFALVDQRSPRARPAVAEITILRRVTERPDVEAADIRKRAGGECDVVGREEP